MMEAVNSKIPDEGEEIDFNRLEIYNYRHLQRLAKLMNFPSNVKKLELIEMIHAKKYCSEKELQTIVNRIKMEHRAKAQTKKKEKRRTFRLQATEVSSTSQSPPITLTPVRPSEYVIQYSSENPPEIMKNNPRPSMVDAGAPFLQKFKSDRVLRSYNSFRRPNYRVLDQTDCVVGVVKSRNTIKEIRQHKRIQKIQEIRHESAFQSVNMSLKNERPVGSSILRNGDRQLVPVISRSLLQNNRPPNPVKQRKLSGIYMPTVSFRQADGRVTKINAVVQRSSANIQLPTNKSFLQKNQLPRAIEPYKVHEIDQSGSDWPSYERRNVNQQIESMCNSRQIDKPKDYDAKRRQYEQNNANAVKLSYKGRTIVSVIPQRTERDQNRNDYTNRQTATNDREVWSIEDQEPIARRSKFNKDNNTLNTEGNTNQHFMNMQHSDTDLRAIERSEIELRNKYPNMSSITEVVPKVYYLEGDERLPRINEVFSQFDETHTKLNQPMFVRVTEESERRRVSPLSINVNNTSLLESLYNFKSRYITNPPLCRIAQAKTFCTFSTTTVPSEVESPTAEYNYCNPYECANMYEERHHSHPYAYAKPEEQLNLRCDEVRNSPTVTIDSQASQDIGDQDTITSPGMIEDALELISQDGDYMERIGMDVRVQCILCDKWAGPKFILEYHLKKEHHHDILHLSSSSSRVQLSLSRSLRDRAWNSQLLQYEDTLYALSAQCTETTLLLALSAIPNDLEIIRRCRITIFNKRSQPFSYECDVNTIPDTMPYEYGRDCLALDVGWLDLMPNSDFSMLVNRDRLPELDRVEITVQIQLFERF